MEVRPPVTAPGLFPASEVGGALAGVVLGQGVSCDLQGHLEQVSAPLWSLLRPWPRTSSGWTDVSGPSRPLL